MNNSKQFLGINWVEEVGPAMIHMNIFIDQQFDKSKCLNKSAHIKAFIVSKS